MVHMRQIYTLTCLPKTVPVIMLVFIYVGLLLIFNQHRFNRDIFGVLNVVRGLGGLSSKYYVVTLR